MSHAVRAISTFAPDVVDVLSNSIWIIVEKLAMSYDWLFVCTYVWLTYNTWWTFISFNVWKQCVSCWWIDKILLFSWMWSWCAIKWQAVTTPYRPYRRCVIQYGYSNCFVRSDDGFFSIAPVGAWQVPWVRCFFFYNLLTVCLVFSAKVWTYYRKLNQGS